MKFPAKITLLLGLIIGNEVSLVFSQCQGLGCLLQSGIIQSLITVTVAKARMAKAKARQARMDAGEPTDESDPCEQYSPALQKDEAGEDDSGPSWTRSAQRNQSAQQLRLMEQQCKREEKRKLYAAARSVASKTRREAYMERKEKMQEMRALRMKEREERVKAMKEKRERIMEEKRARLAQRQKQRDGSPWLA